jgi:hypothetical protein
MGKNHTFEKSWGEKKEGMKFVFECGSIRRAASAIMVGRKIKNSLTVEADFR